MAKDVFRFVLHDENVLNDYGFWVPVSGINTSYFEANPLILDAHNWGVEGKYVSANAAIGKWVDLETKGGQLIATAMFDEKDPEAQKIKSKVEQGILNATSIGFDILEISTDAAWMKQGQTRPTPTKTLLYEASIVPFGANKNALRLRKGGQLITLGAAEQSANDFLNIFLPNIPNKTAMKELLKRLGLAENATEQEAIAALEKLQKNRVESLMQLGKTKGVINDKNEATFRQLAASDYNSVEQLIANTDAPVKSTETPTDPTPTKQETLVDAVKELTKASQNTDANDKSKWGFAEWQKRDPKGLFELRKTDFAKYSELAKAYEGTKK